jgi:hypothetical protein
MMQGLEQTPPATLPTQDQEEDPDRVERICALLEEAGVPEPAIAQVRESCKAMATAAILHCGDRRPLTPRRPTTLAGLVPARPRRVTGHRRTKLGYETDEPAPFSGRPTAGGKMDPVIPPHSSEAQRAAALENMSRIRSFTPADNTYKDGTPFTGTMPNGDQYIHGARLRRPARDAVTHERGHRSTPAMDEASAEGFFTRFPDARRIRSL